MDILRDEVRDCVIVYVMAWLPMRDLAHVRSTCRTLRGYVDVHCRRRAEPPDISPTLAAARAFYHAAMPHVNMADPFQNLLFLEAAGGDFFQRAARVLLAGTAAAAAEPDAARRSREMQIDMVLGDYGMGHSRTAVECVHECISRAGPRPHWNIEDTALALATGTHARTLPWGTVRAERDDSRQAVIVGGDGGDAIFVFADPMAGFRGDGDDGEGRMVAVRPKRVRRTRDAILGAVTDCVRGELRRLRTQHFDELGTRSEAGTRCCYLNDTCTLRDDSASGVVALAQSGCTDTAYQRAAAAAGVMRRRGPDGTYQTSPFIALQREFSGNARICDFDRVLLFADRAKPHLPAVVFYARHLHNTIHRFYYVRVHLAELLGDEQQACALVETAENGLTYLLLPGGGGTVHMTTKRTIMQLCLPGETAVADGRVFGKVPRIHHDLMEFVHTAFDLPQRAEQRAPVSREQLVDMFRHKQLLPRVRQLVDRVPEKKNK